MGFSRGPSIVTDNLVLALDAASLRSFKGEPTENLVDSFPDTNLPANIAWTYEFDAEIVDPPFGVSNSELVGKKWVKLTKNNASNGRVVFLSGLTFTSQSIYTFSAYAFCDDSNIGSIAMNSDNAAFSNEIDEIAYDFSKAGTVQRIHGTWEQLQNSGAVYGMRATAAAPIGSVLYLTGMQVEEKPYPTRLAGNYGVRGTTVATGGGWVDMSGYSNHGELKNTPRFTEEKYGAVTNDISSSSFINLGNNTSMAVTPTDEFTLEVVAKINTVNPSGFTTSVGTVFGRGSTGGSHGIGVKKTESTGQLLLQMGTRAVDQDQVVKVIEKEEIFHAILKYDTEYIEGFVNGTSLGTVFIGDDTGGTFDSSNWGLLSSGAVPGGNSQPCSGSIYLARMYNRALTTEEVLQNYNAVKGRFEV